MSEIFHQLVDWLLLTVGQMGYTGIILLMALESSFFPFPSEVVITPAAYLAAQGDMNIWLVILCGTLGSLIGALFNYWLAMKVGRPFFERYGKYMLISQATLDKADRFFTRHGHISTFIGRLLPGIRQYISLPAGMARMNILVFSIATSLGASIWVSVLAVLGYVFGRNQQILMENLHWITLATIGSCALLAFIYWLGLKIRTQKEI